MDENWLLAIIGALGIKEIWVIIKKRMDLVAKKEERGEKIKTGAIGELNTRIAELEVKIDKLIAENTELRVKLARMEERILLHAKNSIKKRKKDE